MIMDTVKEIFACDATTTTYSKRLSQNGKVNFIVIVVPNFTNVVTATITITDEDANILYTSGAKAKNATYVISNAACPLWDGALLKCTLSGAAGGSGGNVSVRMMIEEA